MSLAYQGGTKTFIPLSHGAFITAHTRLQRPPTELDRESSLSRIDDNHQNMRKDSSTV
jgi:hypothetical protein